MRLLIGAIVAIAILIGIGCGSSIMSRLTLAAELERQVRSEYPTATVEAELLPVVPFFAGAAVAWKTLPQREGAAEVAQEGRKDVSGIYLFGWQLMRWSAGESKGYVERPVGSSH